MLRKAWILVFVKRRTFIKPHKIYSQLYFKGRSKFSENKLYVFTNNDTPLNKISTIYSITAIRDKLCDYRV